MTDIMRAGMTQLTMQNGGITDHEVTVDGKLLYTLDKAYNEKQIFEIRDVVRDMMKLARDEAFQEAEEAAQEKIDAILFVGNRNMDLLKAENVRISEALERHLISGEDEVILPAENN